MPASERVCRWCKHQIYYDLECRAWLKINPATPGSCLVAGFSHEPEIVHLMLEQSVQTGCCHVKLGDISDMDAFTFYPEETTCGKPPLP